MEKKLDFRTLKAEEIECRVGQVKKDGTGFSLLLYKTARTDAEILDETVGAWNWQKRFYQVKNTMVCSVGIYNEERKEWIWKDDGGDESETEAIKGELSDSFKRASGGSSWGIGRELYYSPFIWIKTNESNQPKGVSYSVKEIDYNSKREIVKLTILNDNTGEIVYSYPKGAKVSQNGAKQQKNDIREDLQAPDTIREEDLKQIELYLATIKGNQMKEYAFNEYLTKTYNVYHADKLNFQQGRTVAEFCKKKLNG